jgi:hypothetical protein
VYCHWFRRVGENGQAGFGLFGPFGSQQEAESAAREKYDLEDFSEGLRGSTHGCGQMHRHGCVTSSADASAERVDRVARRRLIRAASGRQYRPGAAHGHRITEALSVGWRALPRSNLQRSTAKA